jgi:hypothetical protein
MKVETRHASSTQCTVTHIYSIYSLYTATRMEHESDSTQTHAQAQTTLTVTLSALADSTPSPDHAPDPALDRTTNARRTRPDVVRAIVDDVSPRSHWRGTAGRRGRGVLIALSPVSSSPSHMLLIHPCPVHTLAPGAQRGGGDKCTYTSHMDVCAEDVCAWRWGVADATQQRARSL